MWPAFYCRNQSVGINGQSLKRNGDNNIKASPQSGV